MSQFTSGSNGISGLLESIEGAYVFALSFYRIIGTPFAVIPALVNASFARCTVSCYLSVAHILRMCGNP